ncbi:MAG: hydroxyacid dehydrogenase [Verrucomicrobiota bacterium]|nr:hydroxyacid dehydrogenase [Verrucomicrobiota bacterium]
MRTRAAFFNEYGAFSESSNLSRVYGEEQLARLRQRVDLHPEVISLANFEAQLPALQDVEVIFSTWGMPCLSDAQISRLPALKAVFYGAGTVQSFAKPFLARNIIVVSGWAANAVPVAEYTFAQIIFSLKRGWTHLLAIRDARGPGGYRQQNVPGAYGAVVGLIGMGMIGRLVAERLKTIQVKVIVSDPYLKPENCAALGVEAVSLETLFATSDVVSLHAPNIPATRGMITGAHFSSMVKGSTFINTARGALIREQEMVEVLTKRSDITALLDVTDPEPPPEGSPLYHLPNVILTPHIAGSLGAECRRMADYVIAEFEAWQEGKPLKYSVNTAMLATMA